jgi:hypothetical protein
MGQVESCDERPMFMRANGEPTTELRGEIPRWVVDILDAVVTARGGQSANVHRTTVVTEVLSEWAEKKLHEASLITRLAAGNPNPTERARRPV